MLDKKGYDLTIHSNLPREWFKEAENATFFGIPLSDYSSEELCAIAAHGWRLFQGGNKAQKEEEN